MLLPPASSASDRSYTEFPFFPVEPGNFSIFSVRGHRASKDPRQSSGLPVNSRCRTIANFRRLNRELNFAEPGIASHHRSPARYCLAKSINAIVPRQMAFCRAEDLTDQDLSARMNWSSLASLDDCTRMQNLILKREDTHRA